MFLMAAAVSNLAQGSEVAAAKVEPHASTILLVSLLAPILIPPWLVLVSENAMPGACVKTTSGWNPGAVTSSPLLN
jgi:hypothetical protein